MNDARERNNIVRKPMREPVHYVLDSSLGLSSNQIHRIAIDRHSRIWLAGPAGAACFDGNFVRVRDRRDGLHCNGLRCVVTDANGTLWIGTDLGLQAIGESGEAKVDSSPFSNSQGLCEDIACVDHALWVGAAQGLFRFERGHADLPPKLAYSAPIGFVESVVAIDQSRAYAASNRLGLVYSENNTWRAIDSPALVDRVVNKLALGHDGQILIGTDAGLFVLNPETQAIAAHPLRSASDSAVTAIADGAQDLWVAFGARLVSYARDANDTKPPREYIVESRVNDLLVDELDNVWIATDTSGLALISCLRNAIERIDIGVDGAVFSIKPRPNSTYVIGGEQLLQMVDLPRIGEPQSRAVPGEMPPTTVWDSYHDGRGRWIASQLGLFYAKDGERYRQRFANDRVLGAPTRVIVAYRDTVWIGTLRGLSRVQDDETSEVTAPDGTSFGYVYTLVVHPIVGMWIGTLGRGLWLSTQAGLQQLAQGALNVAGNTYAIAPGPNRQTLVLQDENVLLLDEAFNARIIERHHPVSGWTAMWLDDHAVAIGASSGLRILDIATGATKLSVNSLLPMRQWEFTNNRTLMRDEQDRLLCGLNGGLIRVDLKLLEQLHVEPHPRRLDVTWNGITPELIDGVYRVVPGRWSLQVRAFAAWFVDHAKLRFQFKLVGFDDEWSPIQSTPAVSYTSLPVGRYEVHCRAVSPVTGIGDGVALCKIRVVAPWWAIGWTAAFSSIAHSYQRLIGSRSRNRTLIERNAELENEVSDRTTKLLLVNESLQRAHDQLQQLSLTDPLTRVANRRGLEQHFASELKRATRFNTTIALLVVDIDHFKMVNDRLGHAAGDEVLRKIANALKSATREGIDLVARYGGEEFVVLLHHARIGEAIELAERLRADVERQKLFSPAAPLGHVTISIGVDAINANAEVSFETLLRGADQALYLAKTGGRNRVVAARDHVGDDSG